MALEVLKSRQQITRSRDELRRRRLSCVTPPWKARLYGRGVLPGVSVGDELKSWDVLRTAQLLETQVSRSEPILDIGAYASEIPCILHRLKFTQLTGIDLNPLVAKMPYAGRVRYSVRDFLRTGFADRSFAAITAISVIEHGFDARALFAEIGRLLRPGGYFIASFDYWPDKIATQGIDLFGLSWTIFSRSEVEAFTGLAARHGLRPLGACHFDSGERPIRCMGREYTFAWMALVRE
jgi:SAM-dependent methyltransferase